MKAICTVIDFGRLAIVDPLHFGRAFACMSGKVLSHNPGREGASVENQAPTERPECKGKHAVFGFNVCQTRNLVIAISRSEHSKAFQHSDQVSDKQSRLATPHRVYIDRQESSHSG